MTAADTSITRIVLPIDLLRHCCCMTRLSTISLAVVEKCSWPCFGCFLLLHNLLGNKSHSKRVAFPIITLLCLLSITFLTALTFSLPLSYDQKFNPHLNHVQGIQRKIQRQSIRSSRPMVNRTSAWTAVIALLATTHPVSVHGHDHSEAKVMDMASFTSSTASPATSDIGSLGSPIVSMTSVPVPSTYFSHSGFSPFILTHIGLMTMAWFFVLPVGTFRTAPFRVQSLRFFHSGHA